MKIKKLMLACVATLVCGASLAQPKPITIGFVGAVTGAQSTFDLVFLTAVKLGVEQINAAGGLSGRKVDLKVVDYASQPANAVTVGTQLLNQGVDVLIGGSGSAGNSALLPVVSRYKVPFVTISNFFGDTTWAFTVIPPFENGQAKAQLGFATDVLKVGNVSVMTVPSPFGQGNLRELKKSAEQKKVRIGEVVSVDLAVSDVTSDLLRIKQSGADVIVTFLGGAAHVILAKNAGSVGLKTPIVYAMDTRERQIQASQQYENIYFGGLGFYSWPNMEDAEMKAACDPVVPNLRKANLEHAYSVSAISYDVIQIIAGAIKKSGAVTGQALRDELEKTAYVGCGGRYHFSPQDHTGQAAGPDPYVIGQWQKDGTFKTLWRDK